MSITIQPGRVPGKREPRVTVVADGHEDVHQLLRLLRANGHHQRVRRAEDQLSYRYLACGLTPRMHQVLNHLRDGLSNQEIADRLHVDVETIRTIVRRLLQRLDARNRAHAVALGYELGLLTPTSRRETS